MATQLQSSTSRIMYALYQANPENLKIPLERIEQILSTAGPKQAEARIKSETYAAEHQIPFETACQLTALEARQTHVIRALNAPNRLEFTQGAIKANLEQLSQETNKEKKQAFVLYQTKYGEFNPKIARLLNEQKTLLSEYQTLTDKEKFEIKELENKFKNKQITAKELNEGTKRIKQEFKDFAKRVVGEDILKEQKSPGRKEVSGHINEIRTLQRDLEDLNQRIWSDIPADKKEKGVRPQPIVEEAQIPRPTQG